MWDSAELLEVRKTIDGSYNIIVLAPENAQQDIQTAQHILADGLQSIEKNVYVHPSSGGFPALPHRDATLNFPYEGRKIEKLQYKISENHVSLTFSPFDGQIVSDSIEIDYSAVDVDFVLAVGVNSKDLLPKAIIGDGPEADRLTYVNVDNNNDNRQWGSFNLILPDIPLYSLLALVFTETFGLPVNEKWQQMAMNEAKGQVPALMNASPRLLRTMADLLENRAGA